MICRFGLYADFYKITVLGLFCLSQLICEISLYAGIYDKQTQNFLIMSIDLNEQVIQIFDNMLFFNNFFVVAYIFFFL